MVERVKTEIQPSLHIEAERLLFRHADGTEHVISLLEILEVGDTQSALLWAVFHRINAMAQQVEGQTALIADNIKTGQDFSDPDHLHDLVSRIAKNTKLAMDGKSPE